MKIGFGQMNGKNMKKKNNKKVYISSFLITGFILLVAFGFSEIYPFGDRSLLIWDSRWQYIQFFSWLKKVLTGHGNLLYSFNSGMGSNMLGLFAYYLASPFNLLILFFKDMQLFVLVLTVLKISMAALTCSVFIKKRFSPMRDLWIVLLSVGYGTMSYSISQKCNLMWLDGLILLPVIAYGIYSLVYEKKKGILYASVLILIIINWYMAYMCCLFSVFYFLYELILKKQEGITTGRLFFKENIRTIIEYVITMVLSVMSSMILFLPTIMNLLQGKGIESSTPYDMEFHVGLGTLLRGFLPGIWKEKEFGTESQGIMLYCGSLALFCVILYFLSKKKSRTEKLVSVLFLCFLIFSAIFIPLENIWNGFRRANSYYCRFSYIISFYMIYLAASYLKTEGILFSKRSIQRILSVLVVAELIFNAYSITRSFAPLGAEDYNKYNRQQSRQFQALNSYDRGFYRTEQASVYGKNRGANYLGVFNEGLMYGYKGFAAYTSTINTKLTILYNQCGYHDYFRFMQYNEPILASDSLWAIKYIVSDHKIEGCKKVKTVSVNKKKNVYKNPYAMSVGFGVNDGDIQDIVAENPFEYQNELLSKLSGYSAKCYKKIKYSKKITPGGVTFTMDNTGKDSILYGYLTNVQKDGSGSYVRVNKKIRTVYSNVTSYKVFQIEDNKKQKQVTVKIKGEIANKDQIDGVFYYLDLKEFSKVISNLKKEQMNVLESKEGYLKGNYKADQRKKLLITIPYDKGWKIKCNGKIIKADANQTFITLKVKKGNNMIEMNYVSPGFYEGIILTIIGILLFAIWQRVEKRKI